MEPTNHEHHTHHAPKKPTISIPAAIITGAVIIAIGLVIGLGRANNTQNAPQQAAGVPDSLPTSVPKEVATLRGTDYVRGSKDAKVLVIEYSDSDCPFCERFHATMDQVIKDYNGSVALVYRYFPLDIHPNAYTEATALECVGQNAGNDAFQKYLDSVIGVTLSPDPKSNAALISYAKDAGVSNDAFKACVEGKKASARIDQDIAEAKQIGVRGTPFSIAVNQKTGKQVIIPGAYPIEEVKKMIDSIK